MYILKRSWYYITRKKGKSITVGIILFIVATLVLIGLLINSAANKTFEVAKNKLGSNVIYKVDTSSAMQEQMNNDGQRMGPGDFSLPDDFTDLTTKEVETIANNSKYVKSYKYNVSYTGNPVDFDEYDVSSGDDSSVEGENSSDMPNNKSINMASLTITGVQEENDVINSTNFLYEGAFFTDEEIENGSNVIIINKSLADLNDLSVGDEITIEQVTMTRNEEEQEETVSVTYKIVGIYESSESADLSGKNFMVSMNMAENAMYVPYTSILKMQESGLSEEEVDVLQQNGYVIESVTFIIDDPDNSDAFIDEVENMDDIDLTYRSLSIDNEAYQKMVGNIESVASTAKILVVVVVVSSVFIIMLLSMLTIKDRKYEIGVLLSLGESKIKILLQLILEVLIIGVISFTLATGVTSIFVQKITNLLLNSEINNTETINMDNVSKDIGGNMPNEDMSSNNQGRASKLDIGKPDTSNLDVETINELTVSLSPLSVLSLYGIGLLIIIIGNTVQAIFVLKLNPKEIMLDK
jgi:putative ABC transport system permease protein